MTDDEMPNEFLRMFENQAPKDIVPVGELTIETVRLLDEYAGRTVQVVTPGEILTDPDGIPIGVGPMTRDTVTLAGAVITQREADRLGIDPSEFPNITIVPLSTDQEESP